MLLTSWMIGMVCSNMNTWQNHQDACSHFVETGMQKTGLYQTDQQVENFYTVKAKDETVSILGKDALYVGIGTAYAYRTYKSKAVDFKLPTMGIADSVSNKVTTNSYSLNLTWKMPFLK